LKLLYLGGTPQTADKITCLVFSISQVQEAACFFWEHMGQAKKTLWNGWLRDFAPALQCFSYQKLADFLEKMYVNKYTDDMDGLGLEMVVCLWVLHSANVDPVSMTGASFEGSGVIPKASSKWKCLNNWSLSRPFSHHCIFLARRLTKSRSFSVNAPHESILAHRIDSNYLLRIIGLGSLKVCLHFVDLMIAALTNYHPRSGLHAVRQSPSLWRLYSVGNDHLDMASKVKDAFVAFRPPRPKKHIKKSIPQVQRRCSFCCAFNGSVVGSAGLRKLVDVTGCWGWDFPALGRVG
jgi:hypothetical protein